MEHDELVDCRGIPITAGGYAAFSVITAGGGSRLRHGRIRAVRFDGKYSTTNRRLPPLIQIEREVAPGIMARWGTRDTSKFIVVESSPARGIDHGA